MVAFNFRSSLTLEPTLHDAGMAQPREFNCRARHGPDYQQRTAPKEGYLRQVYRKLPEYIQTTIRRIK